MKGEANRTVMIYVDQCRDGILSGRYQFASEPEAKAFRGLSRLLLDINACFDREGFPQSFEELRRFRKPAGPAAFSAGQTDRSRGAVATFSLRILFRQNASWQGSVKWVEGEQEEYFRSVLELMVLIDNAVGYGRNG